MDVVRRTRKVGQLYTEFMLQVSPDESRESSPNDDLLFPFRCFEGVRLHRSRWSGRKDLGARLACWEEVTASREHATSNSQPPCSGV